MRLSKEFGHLSREDHEEIIKKVVQSFNEERKKHLETLIDSTARMLRQSTSVTEQMNSAYCLSLMPFHKNENGLKKLLDQCGAIRETLNKNPDLKQYVADKLIKQLDRSAFTNPEVKQTVDEVKLALMGTDHEVLERLKPVMLAKKASAPQPKRTPIAKKAKTAGDAETMSQSSTKPGRKRKRNEMSASVEPEVIVLDDDSMHTD